MEPVGIRDFIYLVIIAITGITTFLTTKHKLKERIQLVKEELKDQINKQERMFSSEIKRLDLDIQKLKGKDENQQQIIDQFQKQVLDHLPALFEILNSKKEEK